MLVVNWSALFAVAVAIRRASVALSSAVEVPSVDSSKAGTLEVYEPCLCTLCRAELCKWLIGMVFMCDATRPALSAKTPMKTGPRARFALLGRFYDASDPIF